MMNTSDPKAVARFWSKVQRTSGCWLWTGSKIRGYGTFMVGRKNIRGSRFSYELHKGPIGDLYVCHACDNPTCVNPDHLFLGTAKDNLDDAIRKGRFPVQRDMVKVRASIEATGTWFPSGERHPAAKLNAQAVREIRRLCAGGTSQWAMARRFSVGPKTINHIVHRRTWAHIADDPTTTGDRVVRTRLRPKCSVCKKYVRRGEECCVGCEQSLSSHVMVER